MIIKKNGFVVSWRHVLYPCPQRALNKLKKRKSTGDCSETLLTSQVKAASYRLYTSDILPTTPKLCKTKLVAAVKEVVSNKPELKTTEHSDPANHIHLESPV